MAYTPSIGDYLPVQLPGELVRGEIMDVIDDDTVIMALSLGSPFRTNSHRFELNDWLKARREPGPLMGERWVSLGKVRKPQAVPVEEKPKAKRRERST